MMLSMRRREATEMRTMALICASLGEREQAIDCLVRATSLDNPLIAAETERFSSESAVKFDAFKEMWERMHGKKGGS